MKRKVLEGISFPLCAERVGAVYEDKTDTLRLIMLGQEYTISRSGIILRGQKAPDAHVTVLLAYLSSPGAPFLETPWRAIGDFAASTATELRKRVEIPLAPHVSDFISRANTLAPLFGAFPSPSLIGSDSAITVRALPKVHFHVEMSRENQEFPPEVWVLFSNNADQFLGLEHLQLLAELFKDRLLSLLRIY